MDKIRLIYNNKFEQMDKTVHRLYYGISVHNAQYEVKILSGIYNEVSTMHL